MKPIVALVIVLFLSGNCPAQESNTDFWLTFEQLEDSLRVNPKPVFLYFHTDWCTYCRKMEAEVFKKPRVVEQLSTQFYAVKFDAEYPGEVDFDGRIFSNGQLKTSRNPLHDLALLFNGQNSTFAPPLMVFLDGDFVLKKRVNQYMDSKALVETLESLF
jgi:thioredoxin-related protein